MITMQTTPISRWANSSSLLFRFYLSANLCGNEIFRIYSKQKLLICLRSELTFASNVVLSSAIKTAKLKKEKTSKWYFKLKPSDHNDDDGAGETIKTDTNLELVPQ